MKYQMCPAEIYLMRFNLMLGIDLFTFFFSIQNTNRINIVTKTIIIYLVIFMFFFLNSDRYVV